MSKDGAYCCLGVLCEVGGVPFKGSNGLPSITNYDALKVSDTSKQWRYADMNDDGQTFEEIADILEREVEVDGEETDV